MHRSFLRPVAAVLVVVAACLGPDESRPSRILPEPTPKTPKVEPTPAPRPGQPLRVALDADVVGSSTWTSGHRAGLRVQGYRAVDLRRLEPLSSGEAILTLAVGDERRELARATLGRTGAADLQFRVPELATGDYHATLLVRSSGSERELPVDVSVTRAVRTMLTTDKPLYQPGQTIHMRALALGAMDLRPASGAVTFEVADGRGNKVFKKVVTADRFGVASADFRLAEAVNPGAYQLSATVADAPVAERTVDVRRYSLPKFRVEIDGTEPFYRPGARVRGTVRAEYFFGRKVRGTVRVTGSTFDVGWNAIATVDGRLDAEGRFPFEMTLPDRLAGVPLAQGNALVRFEVAVVDGAAHTERVTRSVPVAQDLLRVELVPESGRFVGDLENQVFAVATTPDGRPAEADLLVRASGREVRARTDTAGIARFALALPASSIGWRGSDATGCAGQQGALVDIEARTTRGDVVRESRCLPAQPGGTAPILLRTDRALYTSGQAMRVEVIAPGNAPVFLSIIKGGQTVLTSTLERTGGIARRDIALPTDLFGTLEVHAYRVDGDGNVVRDGRVVYVEPAAGLQVAIQPDRAEYRPGDDARVRFRVTDAQGRGVAAALGVVVVDESVYALSDAQAGLEKVFFTLERELLTPRVELHMGESVDHLVGARADARRENAARVLLAAIEPERDLSRLRDARAVRAAFESSQLPQVFEAVKQWTLSHQAFARTAEGLRFRPDTMQQMRAADAISEDLARAPDGRLLTPGLLRSIDPTFSFYAVARLAAAQRFQEIANVVARTRDVQSLETLVASGALTRDKIRDPWGFAFLVRRAAPRAQVYGVAPGYELASPGPDGRVGTADDITSAEPFLVPAEQQGPFANFVRASTGWGWRMARGAGGIAFDMAAEAAPMPQAMPAPVATATAPSVPEPATTRQAQQPGAAPAPRVREFFPETMLWAPAVITDAQGEATLRIPVADSITTWRMSASASSAAGALGAATAPLRVFQDFFVDLDLPPTLTQNDEVSVPVAVYNYMTESQRVSLRIELDAAMRLSGAAEQALVVEPGEVTVRYFRVRAQTPGQARLTVHAAGTRLSDAVRRTVLVEPDGRPETFTTSEPLEREATVSIQLPEQAIAGSERAVLKVFGGAGAQAVDNLDSLLRMPSGCFEQTSSTTYPNVLVLKYLRDSRRSSPELELRATEYISLGYQRLLTFEVDGGGFEWFGNAPAHRILTAYGLMEFADMARVHEIDPRVIERTQAWLGRQQRPDGTWQPDEGGIAEGAINAYQGSVLRTTAYVAWALVHSGARGPARDRALGWLRQHAPEARDAYTRAVLANALLEASAADPAGLQVVDRLAESARVEGGKASWTDAEGAGLTHSTGDAHTIETTALAAMALVRAGRHRAVADKALAYLVGNKDAFGNWQTTQATILALRAMLSSGERGSDRTAQITVEVDGRSAGRLEVRPDNRTVVQALDLRPFLHRGESRVRIRASEDAGVFFQLAGQYHVPWGTAAREPAGAGPLSIGVEYDRRDLRVDDTVTVTATLRYRGEAAGQMPLVDLGVPPGFQVEAADLDRLVTDHTILRYSVTPRQLIVYLDELRPAQTLTLRYRLRAKLPVRAQAPASEAYLYYTPEERGATRPVLLTVAPR